MVLDLSPYRGKEPYPKVGRVRRDTALATELMEGYCGGVSELTTVLQYAYHSLRCKEKNEKISTVMRGIFYVETIHMELLGDCVQKLGIVPRYDLALGEKIVPWQSGLVTYESSPAKMLLADIAGEKQAVEFYVQTAAKVTQPEIALLLLRLAEDEKLHVRMLTELYRKTFQP